jgi:hypothetical protein
LDHFQASVLNRIGDLESSIKRVVSEEVEKVRTRELWLIMTELQSMTSTLSAINKDVNQGVSTMGIGFKLLHDSLWDWRYDLPPDDGSTLVC